MILRIGMLLGIALSCGQVFASDRIQVKVVAKCKAMAVGYLVEGERLGGLGKSYTGKGPINKKYRFGYRKHPIGADIPCGTITLNKNSEVELITKDDLCYTVVHTF